jgi:hypothetical protein
MVRCRLFLTRLEGNWRGPGARSSADLPPILAIGRIPMPVPRAQVAQLAVDLHGPLAVAPAPAGSGVEQSGHDGKCEPLRAVEVVQVVEVVRDGLLSTQRWHTRVTPRLSLPRRGPTPADRTRHH